MAQSRLSDWISTGSVVGSRVMMVLGSMICPTGCAR